ncbi:MAG: hypothetical protein ABI939_05495, partial [Anaerolineaceae bacterium]
MLVPPVRGHGFFLPSALEPVLMGAFAIAATLLAWAFFDASSISNDNSFAALPLVNAAEIHSVAYFAPAEGNDVLYVRQLEEPAPGRPVDTFRSTFSLHARGTASPLGDAVAVLSVSPSFSPYASLSLIRLPDGSFRDLGGPLDYLSPLAWSADGSHLATRRSTLPDESGRVSVEVIEFAIAMGTNQVVARFENALDAAPVGYSLDGNRLFVVVLDQSGSTLWAERDGRTQRVATLSPGRTRDWSLSPDGSRLAYIEAVGAGERAYAGRVLIIATGAITSTVVTGNQFGAAWFPGSQAPVFGGPGGSLRLSEAPNDNAYVVPQRWSPDGSTLVGAV